MRPTLTQQSSRPPPAECALRALRAMQVPGEKQAPSTLRKQALAFSVKRLLGGRCSAVFTLLDLSTKHDAMTAWLSFKRKSC